MIAIIQLTLFYAITHKILRRINKCGIEQETQYDYVGKTNGVTIGKKNHCDDLTINPRGKTNHCMELKI